MNAETPDFSPQSEEDRLTEARNRSDHELLQGGSRIQLTAEQITAIELGRDQSIQAAREAVERAASSPEAPARPEMTLQDIAHHLMARPARELTSLELEAIMLAVACVDYGTAYYNDAGGVAGRQDK